jgi:hypothetical protein
MSFAAGLAVLLVRQDPHRLDPVLPAQPKKAQHQTLALQMEDEGYPYWAYRKLGFFQPAIRVASCEGERQKHKWDNAFALEVHNRLQGYLKALAAATHDQTPPAS